ncbi:MAG TPA: hypothetical protein VH082_07255, partial [Rudaea sp.]|nr:hypothetical protein [Rudaea sp.]
MRVWDGVVSGGETAFFVEFVGAEFQIKSLRSSFPRKRESSNFAFDVFWSKSFRRKRRVTFCSTAKSHQKTFLIVLGVCCPQTARPCCWLRTAR